MKEDQTGETLLEKVIIFTNEFTPLKVALDVIVKN